ncbi:iron(III) transport system substrate-binding protein [Tamilnaduibacter salinus]|uniref:Iron ABC transporter substrate-binding protein n=1 Tax=Tamilnaduibacter salinus TaxID=1484056 RepID=A0A2A2HZS5_9GAMM|nr:Fe(3+) ABC transporter substrate-binding protein [Tamilnaduibacter salinus]PAV25231.1 iron ABC transporter substrate-binding protein [Tamilnaduibacter salinus]PVY75306.1 iron(III) transport system substrate-binding protein [Tamilnaduibacter salinus]
MKLRNIILGSALAASTFMPAAASASGDVNIYSYRQAYLLEPLLDAFTEKTGIDANVVFAKKGLAERLAREGENSPADLVLTTDISRLNELVERGLTQSVVTDTLNDNIPSSLRHSEGLWYGLTTRARLIFASNERVEEGAITTYEELADERWDDRICTRSGKHPYNIALFSSMIAHHGVEEAEQWLEGLKDNLARKPQGGDRDQIKAIAAGECDLSIGNSYYYGKMLQDENQKAIANQVHLVFPNADDRGTHVNVSGMAMTQSAPNRDNAVKLMNYLASEEAQSIYARVNFEYPANPAVAPSELVSGWGTLNRDDLPLETIADYREEAVKMVDRVRYDN